MTAEGKPLEELEVREYDPRERPWYTAAVEAGVPTWSPIYVFSARPILGISPVSPVYDRFGNLKGVLGIDLTLGEISDFLRSLEISENGEAFIIQRDGKLVAASTEEQPFKIVDDQQQLLDVRESGTALLRITSEHILTEYNNDFANIKEGRDITFEKDGETYYAQIDIISDERGLDWISVVVVPSSDFLGPVLQNLRNTAMFGLIVLLLSTVLGFLLSSWIIRPIFTVTDVAANIEDSVWDLEPLHVVIERTDELGQLARVFEKMAKEIQSREMELKRQVVALKIQIDQKKRESQVNEIVDSDFFQGLREKARIMREAGRKKDSND
jgi:HAMP domain-containing protein